MCVTESADAVPSTSATASDSTGTVCVTESADAVPSTSATASTGTVCVTESADAVPSTSATASDSTGTVCVTESAISGVNEATHASGVTFYQLVNKEQDPCQRSTRKAVNRKVWHATAITSSPYKAELHSAKVKQSKPVKRAGIDNGAAAKKCLKPTQSKHPPQSHYKEQSKKSSKKQTSLQQRKKGRRSSKKTKLVDSSSEDDEDTFCLVCTEPFSNSKSKEVWIQCTRCKMWAHELCTSRDSIANMFYVCDNCDSDADMESDMESDDC